MPENRPLRRTTAGSGRVTGSYDLMGVNGSVLPTAVEDTVVMADVEDLRCRLLAGELRLEEDGSYRIALTARYDTGAGAAYTRVVESGGTWRFLASALDEWSGEVTLTSRNGSCTSAAVTEVSLVHRTPAPGPERGRAESTWVYLRRSL